MTWRRLQSQALVLLQLRYSPAPYEAMNHTEKLPGGCRLPSDAVPILKGRRPVAQAGGASSAPSNLKPEVAQFRLRSPRRSDAQPPPALTVSGYPPVIFASLQLPQRINPPAAGGRAGDGGFDERLGHAGSSGATHRGEGCAGLHGARPPCGGAVPAEGRRRGRRAGCGGLAVVAAGSLQAVDGIRDRRRAALGALLGRAAPARQPVAGARAGGQAAGAALRVRDGAGCAPLRAAGQPSRPRA
jgi:hypothetical protein